MSIAAFLFNAFVLLTLAGAIGVVVCRNAVNSAMCLLLSLVGIAGLFVALDAYLLAFLLLLVYAGAVVALFLFIVMLLDVRGDARPTLHRLPVVARVLAIGLVLGGVASFFVRGRLPAPDAATVPLVGAALKPYAQQLFSTYLLPVQILGFLLLIAMLGVIVLSRKFEAAEEAR